MHDVDLDLGLREHRVDRIRETLGPIDYGDQDVVRVCWVYCAAVEFVYFANNLLDITSPAFEISSTMKARTRVSVRCSNAARICRC
jgi:hypothetical protein